MGVFDNARTNDSISSLILHTKMKVKLKGIRMHGRLYLSGLARAGVDIKKIPPYFDIEIDTEKIKERVKERRR